VMVARVVGSGGGHRLAGDVGDAVLVNRFLDHLSTRSFSPATVRAYAFDLANFLGFLADVGLVANAVRPVDLFSYLDWQRSQRASVAAATMNRRVSTVRSWFEFLVTLQGIRSRGRAGHRGCARSATACSVMSPGRLG
jgi:integrase/recombinase XerC